VWTFPARLEPGARYPLGATWDGLGTNFAVFSTAAEKIELCLFDAAGRREIHRFPLPSFDGEVWHGYLPDAGPGLVYGYRAYGPYEPRNGKRFNHHKLLLDPYARQLTGRLRWTDALFGYRIRSPQADLSFDRRDSGPAMVKAVVTGPDFNWQDDKRPKTSWADTVIYELHTKGFTQLFEAISPPERGKFAALARPPVIAHLQRLGITAVELMPIHAFLQERHLVDRNLANYWGYSTLAFFAPEPAYLIDSADELRIAIRRLHAAGIEVLLDVVYNHSCEGNELGPTLSWRGLDNDVYYRLPEDRRYFINDTGTGNTLNLTHARVLQMVMDSLRYWAESFHVDGFRFDLGAALGREPSGFDPGSGFFDAIRQDPLLSQLKLISEPWDPGPGGYQLGNHPPPFAEWNDRYRDTVRRYWRGDSGMRPELASRLSGSADIFNPPARSSWSSINFVASHDGMTLTDLVTYEHKHNEANAEDNRDGADENFSANWGEEGPTSNPAINELRQRVIRSMLLALFMSRGTPMLLAGDEFGRSQGGNNNAYCQDNEISWLDWTQAESDVGELLILLVGRMIAIRKTFSFLLSPGRRFDVAWSDLNAIEWLDERNFRLSESDWENREGRALVARYSGERADGKVELLALLMNASDRDLDFKLPETVSWLVLLDTADSNRAMVELENGSYRVRDRAAVLINGVADEPLPAGEAV
jgi:isoamylase